MGVPYKRFGSSSPVFLQLRGTVNSHSYHTEKCVRNVGSMRTIKLEFLVGTGQRSDGRKRYKLLV